MEAPFSRLVPGGPANQAAFAHERFPGRLVVDRNTPDGRTADARVGGRVAAIQMRQDIRVPEDRPAVDEHESARMLSDLETGPLELDEPLEGFKGWIEPLRKRRGLVVVEPGTSEASTSDASTPRSTTKTSAVRASSSTERKSSSLATSKGRLKPSRSTAVASIRSRTGLAPMYPIVASADETASESATNGRTWPESYVSSKGTRAASEGIRGARIVRNRGDQGGGEARSGPLVDRHLLELDVGEGPKYPVEPAARPDRLWRRTDRDRSRPSPSRGKRCARGCGCSGTRRGSRQGSRSSRAGRASACSGSSRRDSRAASPRRARRSQGSPPEESAENRRAHRSGSTRCSQSARPAAGQCRGARPRPSRGWGRSSAAVPRATRGARIAASRRTRPGARCRSRSGSRSARGKKIMSVFVERSQRFEGFARRTPAFRATGSIAGRCVRAAKRCSCISAGTRKTRSSPRQRSVSVSARASTNVGSSSGVL